MNNIYVLYHGNCYDGFGAAYCAYHKFEDTAEYVSCNYVEKDVPLEKIPDGSEVYVLDFSFSREGLIAANQRFSKLVVLDHHISAQKNLEGLEFCTFDQTKSGALLSFEYFIPPNHRGGHLEKLIQHISDRDLWQFKLIGTHEIHAALCSYPMDFKVWDAFELSTLMTEGVVLLRAKRSAVQRLCDKAALITIDGHQVPACNVSEHFSEVPNELLNRFPDSPFAAYWYDYYLPDQQKLTRQVGLRSRGDFDVSELAKKFGGGGHKAAAGYHIELEMRTV